MGSRFWRLAACAAAMTLALYSLWSLGVLSALAARLEPAPAETALPEPEPSSVPSAEPTPSPVETIKPEPAPPSSETAAPVFARSDLPRVDDRTPGHDLAALFGEAWRLPLPDQRSYQFIQNLEVIF